jgi:hypothetical protein
VLGLSGLFLDRRHMQNAFQVEIHPAQHFGACFPGAQSVHAEASDRNVFERILVIALEDFDFHHRLRG